MAFTRWTTVRRWLCGCSRAGYRTGFLGKYLNGYGRQEPYDGDNRPPVVDGSSSSYVPPGWNDWRASLAGTYHYFRTRISDQGQGTTSLSGRYQTRAYGDVASQMIRKYAALRRPFFLVTSFTAPHSGRPLEDDDPPPVSDDGEVIGRVVTPAVPGDRRDSYNDVVVKLPGRGEASVRDKPEELRQEPPTEAQQAALLEATRQRAEAESVVDDQVRRIVATLRASGELDNTYIIFSSDNGYLLGEHRVKQGKLLPWDPSLRVPFLVRGPGIPAGEVRSDPISVVDWAPTILQMADAPMPAGHKLDGVPLLDIARFGDRGWVRAIGTESGPKNRQEVGGRQRGIRTPRYLYTDYGAGEEELYDLAMDPWQNCNLLGPLRARRVDPDCEAIGGDQPLRPRYRRAAGTLRDLRQEFEPVGPGRGCAGRSCRQLLLPGFLRTRPIPRPPVYWQVASQRR